MTDNQQQNDPCNMCHVGDTNQAPCNTCQPIDLKNPMLLVADFDPKSAWPWSFTNCLTGEKETAMSFSQIWHRIRCALDDHKNRCEAKEND